MLLVSSPYKFSISSKYGKCILSLLLMMGLLQSCAAMQKKHKLKKEQVVYTMTVADVYPPKEGEDFSTITFYQSQRFYKLPNNADPSYLILLKEARQNKAYVEITRAYEKSDVILKVKKPKKQI
jgi:hypothetical protein